MLSKYFSSVMMGKGSYGRNPPMKYIFSNGVHADSFVVKKRKYEVAGSNHTAIDVFAY